MTSEVKRVPIPPRGVDYRGKVVLAPMVRTGELPTRLVALQYGADLVWGPETVDRAMIGTLRRFNEHAKTLEWYRVCAQGRKTAVTETKENIIYRMHPEKEAGKLIFQMGTADPDRAVQAAKTVAADVAGIDVNAGCPKPFSTHGGMGAALLKEPDKLCAILEALVRDIAPQYEIGISVKIRVLETAAETEVLVRRLCATGITGLTVHCRTTPMRPRERAIRDQLRMIAEVCREAGVACLVNGDVETKDEGLKLAEEFGADGAMIATAAEKNPSCFMTLAQGGPRPWQEVSEQYVRTAMEVGNRFGNTKYVLQQLVPGKGGYAQAVSQSRTYADICKNLCLGNLMDLALDMTPNRGLNMASEKGPIKGRSSATALAAGGQMAQARKDQQQAKKVFSERQVKTSDPESLVAASAG